MKKVHRLPYIMTLTLLLILTCTTPSMGAIVSGMKPYLQAVNRATNSVYVLLECTTTDTVTVQWGPTTSYGSSATTEFQLATLISTYVHRVKLTGLTPGAVYHYRAGQGGVYSADSTFTAAPSPGASFRFAVHTDCRSQTAIHNNVAGQILDFNPTLMLEGGDLCASTVYSDWKGQYFISNEMTLINKTPMVNAPGNHETSGQNTKAFTQGTNGDKLYFSFDYGDAHFVVIDTNDSALGTVGSTQYNWIDQDLANTTKPWKFVIWHMSAYCAGGHNENAASKTISHNILVPRGVQVVFSGHSHFYQHNLFEGIHHIQIGTCGAWTNVPGVKDYVLMSLQDYCYSIVDMTPSTFHMEIYEDGGSLVDMLNLSVGPPPSSTPTPTPMPTPTPTPTPTSTPTPAPTPTPTGGEGSYQLQPTADAYVYGGATTTNYGTDVDLIVRDGLDTSWDRISYLKFNLSGISGTISAATLKLYCNNLPEGSPVPAKIFSVTNDTWTETGITWSNMPATVAQLASGSVTATGAWYSFNVTSFVNAQYGGDQVVSLAVVDDTEAKMRVDFNSGEASANQPYLEVITEGVSHTHTHAGTDTHANAGPDPDADSHTDTDAYTDGWRDIQLEPIADSYVLSTSTGADSNFGTETALVVKDGSATTNDRITYLKFDLAGVSGASVTSATLKLYVCELPDGTPVPFKVFSVTDDGWTELGLTWNNRPAAATQLASNSGVSALGWVNLTVTSFVNGQYGGDRIVSLAVLDNTQAALRVKFSSKEEVSNHPQLEVVTN